MIKIFIHPQSDQTFTLTHSFKGGDAALRKYIHPDDYIEGCQRRAEIAIDVAESLPDEEMELKMEDRTTRMLMEVISESAWDHILGKDLETALALLETLYIYDMEDTFSMIPTLCMCYLEDEQWDTFDETISDIDEKSYLNPVLTAYKEYLIDGTCSNHTLSRLKKYPALVNEIKSLDHTMTPQMQEDLLQENPKEETLVRNLYLQLEQIISHNNEVVNYLKQNI